MQIEIEESVTTKKTIDIEFPYYYRHDCSGDAYNSVWYGKIDGNRVFKVNHSESLTTERIGYEFEVSDFSSSFHCYFKKEYRSTEEEFLAAKRKMLAELSAVDDADALQKAGYSSVGKLIQDINLHKQRYNFILEKRANPLFIKLNSGTKVANADEKFEKLWAEQPSYAEKNKSATYAGFLMALDYLGNLK